MMSRLFEERYLKLQELIQTKVMASGRSLDEVTLVAVSKHVPIDAMQQVYLSGCRDFGESRYLEASEKWPLMPPDVRWHFIGTLQTKKVSKVIPHFHLIHSVDTPSLALHINQVSEKKEVQTSILLQVNTSGESAKHGFSPQEWEKHLDDLQNLKHVHIKGLMTMAPLTSDQDVIRKCFRTLFELREKWKSRMPEPEHFHDLSMGMSHDFEIAIEEGATLLRIGSRLFS